jgi:serine/threonine protein kinase
MLIYDPENRASAKKLLEHRYFADIRLDYIPPSSKSFVGLIINYVILLQRNRIDKEDQKCIADEYFAERFRAVEEAFDSRLLILGETLQVTGTVIICFGVHWTALHGPFG